MAKGLETTAAKVSGTSGDQTPDQLAAKAKKLRAARVKVHEGLPRQSAKDLREKAKAKLAPKGKVRTNAKSTTDQGD